MNSHFESVFRKPDAPASRGTYLSRVFGIFSEEIVRVWANDQRCPYEDLGRPTLRRPGENRGSTLDFTLRDKASGKCFVAELKCEIEYQNYRYLVLSDITQLAHHRKAAFNALLDAAKRCPKLSTYVAGKELEIDGAILIWGAATPEGRQSVIDEYGFADVLTMAEITHDLRSWGSGEYQKLVEDRRCWANEMFDQLLAN